MLVTRLDVPIHLERRAQAPLRAMSTRRAICTFDSYSPYSRSKKSMAFASPS